MGSLWSDLKRTGLIDNKGDAEKQRKLREGQWKRIAAVIDADAVEQLRFSDALKHWEGRFRG
jgi:hypothetical protein